MPIGDLSIKYMSTEMTERVFLCDWNEKKNDGVGCQALCLRMVFTRWGVIGIDGCVAAIWSGDSESRAVLAVHNVHHKHIGRNVRERGWS